MIPTLATTTTIDDIREQIISSEKVAHVTFYLVKDKDDPFEESFFVYSESKNRGLERLTDYPEPRVSALEEIRFHAQRLEDILEKKRKGTPTSKQVYFLFLHKIPISLTLTWGEASDLIDEKLNQLEYEKQEYLQKKAEKFKGFTVGQRIACQFLHPLRLSSGTITKLTSNNRGSHYMYVEYDDGEICRWPLNGLPRIVEEGTKELTPYFRPGQQVSHRIFGIGEVITSELEGQSEFVEVQFQGEYGKKRLCMNFAKLEKTEDQP
jgi:hypothetical protein